MCECVGVQGAARAGGKPCPTPLACLRVHAAALRCPQAAETAALRPNPPSLHPALAGVLALRRRSATGV